jgi:hypothetical protein
MSDRDYYEVLGLTPEADGAMVDQAYWHLARKYQKLSGTTITGQRMLDDLNEAYGVLGTPRLRRQYDAFRDEVLIGKGVLKPVTAKQKRLRKDEKRARVSGGHGVSLPRVAVPGVAHWRTYAAAAAVFIGAGAAGWYGLNAMFAGLGLGAGLVLALLPALKQRAPQMPQVRLSRPSLPAVELPSVRIPEIKAPKIALPQLDLAPAEEDEEVTPDEIRASTAAMIARWRKSVGLKPVALSELGPALGAPAPSTTLVEIVESEREIEDAENAPLDAVIDILRGARRTAPELPDR